MLSEFWFAAFFATRELAKCRDKVLTDDRLHLLRLLGLGPRKYVVM